MFLFPIFFVKSGEKTFITAVLSKSYKLMKKIKRDELENSLFVWFISYYEFAIFCIKSQSGREGD